MQDISLHILDISENSISAGATKIEIMVREETNNNRLVLKIKDNGSGIDEKTQQKILDPFYTTKTYKRVGLGLSLLAQATKEAQGNLEIKSQKGKGTTITANFMHDHIDRKPLGDISETILALVAGKGSEIDFDYKHFRDGAAFHFNTKEIKKDLEDIPINNPEVLNFLKEKIKAGLKEMEEGGN
jgi:hypothetical protein